MRNLFDLFDERPDESDWQEVPQALYLSWSEARQLAYCAARDEDSAATCLDGDERALWFLRRAEHYKEMMKSCS